MDRWAWLSFSLKRIV